MKEIEFPWEYVEKMLCRLKWIDKGTLVNGSRTYEKQGERVTIQINKSYSKKYLKTLFVVRRLKHLATQI